MWPSPQCLDYGWPVETRWLIGIGLPGLLVVGLVLFSVWNLIRGRRSGFLGIAFFLILAPTSSIMPIQDLCVEHRMYLPLACLALAGVLAGNQISAEAAGSLASPLSGDRGAGGGGHTGRTDDPAQSRSTPSAVGMWMDVLQSDQGNRSRSHLGRALNNLGDALLDAGHTQDGLVALRQAEELQPDTAEIQANLGRGAAAVG